VRRILKGLGFTVDIDICILIYVYLQLYTSMSTHAYNINIYIDIYILTTIYIYVYTYTYIFICIYSYYSEAKVRRILTGLGFTVEMQNSDSLHLSGGWRVRLSLARALYMVYMYVCMYE
jgi:ABC-type Mn2+/Zn2+ transport system ATPase subunit